MEIIIDKRVNNVLLRQDFDNYIQKKFEAKSHSLKPVIRHLPSHFHKGLQAADFIAWAINRKETLGQDEYYKLIEKRIRNAKRIGKINKKSVDPKSLF